MGKEWHAVRNVLSLQEIVAQVCRCYLVGILAVSNSRTLGTGVEDLLDGE
jgi:hypothetical protein